MNTASSANASQAATPPNIMAPTGNKQPISDVLTPTVTLVPVSGSKAQAKRKRGDVDEGSPTTKRGKVAQEDDKFTPERKRLRRHMDPQFKQDQSCRPIGLKHYPLFLLQRPPESATEGAKCNLNKCDGVITQGTYRIALNPGMYTQPGFESYPWYYHVKCFENLVDLSSPHYAARFEADRDGFTPDIKAVEILEEYVLRWQLRTPKDQVERPAIPASLADKTEKSSQAASVNQAWVLAERLHERIREKMEMSYQRHNQFDPEDHLEENKWDVNKYLLPATHPEYSERHALSQALDAHYKVLEDDAYDCVNDWAL